MQANPDTSAPTIGVLLVNLGSPDAPTAPAVRRYLNQFLSDRRIVEIPPVIWQPILKGVIVPLRPFKTVRAYQQIWGEYGDSPLRAITADQARLLGERMPPEVMVDYAMSYGNPSIPDRLAAMTRAGVNRILIAPLYPQYSGTTTGAVSDAVGDVLKRMRHVPAIRMLPSYPQHPAYIDALAETTRRGLAGLGWEPDTLLLSFHGIPVRACKAGDPYDVECMATAAALREALGLSEDQMPIAFQSRFGADKWLSPATSDMLTALPAQGRRKVAVLTPGFIADCLETLEEIAIEGRDIFLAAGGTDFAAIPCLNASVPSIDMLQELAEEQLAGWIKPR